jgi:hypothetical protein
MVFFIYSDWEAKVNIENPARGRRLFALSLNISDFHETAIEFLGKNEKNFSLLL